MTTPNTYNKFSASSKRGMAKQWLQHRLQKLPSIQPSGDEGDGGLRTTASLERPRTAPSSGIATALGSDEIPAVPPIPINIPRGKQSSSIQPPGRPSRPDSDVARDINAWLDASKTPSPPLMGGVSYWRMATDANVSNTVGIQHARPIVQEPQPVCDRSSTSHSQQASSFRRRAKKIQAQIPLVNNKSLRQADGMQVNTRSNSTPVLGIPYEAIEEGTPPVIMTRRRSPTIRLLSSVSSTSPGSRPVSGEPILEQPKFLYGGSSSTRTSEVESSIDRRTQTLLRRITRSDDSTRPSTAAHMQREGSMGDLSDAPTYLTGPSPPSYHSRPASILSTSSFGCIDGMNPAQRQVSQQRAAQRRGVKGRWKRFAQNFTNST
ncbi:hypothetical protein HBI16_091450 [Parastagonospora nodorum]|nr:hypothetical protein HBI16_091450 [Parastagonospora nodorum]